MFWFWRDFIDPCGACDSSVQLIDLRAQHDLGLVRLKDGQQRRWETRPRPRGSVTGICMHQWGKPAPGLSDAARRRISAGQSTGQEEYALRAQRTVYHIDYGVYGDVPFVVLVHPIEMYMWAAHGANETTVSVACMGAFPRLERDRDSSVHKPAPSAALASAGRAAICAAVRMIRFHGHLGDVELTGHGQWIRKPADPGEWIYRRIVLPAVDAGVVTFDPSFRRGSGSSVDF